MTKTQSALPRAIDLRYPSNRFAAGGFVVGVLLSRSLGRRWPQAVGDGLAGFTAWAIARELDPDYPATANAALPLGWAASVAGGPPNPLGSFAALSGLRLLAGTVGLAPTTSDVWTLAAVSTLTALSGERVTAALPGTALGLSVAHHDQFSPAPAAALALAPVLLPSLRANPPSGLPANLLSLAALATFGPLTQYEAIGSQCDQTPTEVVAGRVKQARQLALGGLAAALALQQTRSLTPLAAAVLSVGWRRSKKDGTPRVSPRRAT